MFLHLIPYLVDNYLICGICVCGCVCFLQAGRSGRFVVFWMLHGLRLNPKHIPERNVYAT
jgi:hypothetical protein